MSFGADANWRNGLILPVMRAQVFRCRDCKNRFWVGVQWRFVILGFLGVSMAAGFATGHHVRASKPRRAGCRRCHAEESAEIPRYRKPRSPGDSLRCRLFRVPKTIRRWRRLRCTRSAADGQSVVSVVDDFAADHGQHRFQMFDCFVRHLFRVEVIVAQHSQVG